MAKKIISASVAMDAYDKSSKDAFSKWFEGAVDEINAAIKYTSPTCNMQRIGVSGQRVRLSQRIGRAGALVTKTSTTSQSC